MDLSSLPMPIFRSDQCRECGEAITNPSGFCDEDCFLLWKFGPTRQEPSIQEEFRG